MKQILWEYVLSLAIHWFILVSVVFRTLYTSFFNFIIKPLSGINYVNCESFKLKIGHKVIWYYSVLHVVLWFTP